MPRPASCYCGRCPTCKGRERSARRRQDPAHREEMRRRARERYARIRADAQAYAAMLEEAREHQRERRSNGQGPRMRELDRARYWRRRAVGRGLTLAELVDRTGVAVELLLVVLADECHERRIWQDPADGRYRILYGGLDAKTMRALVELAER